MSSPYVNLVSSAVGAGIAEWVTLPICSVKTNYQVHVGHQTSWGVVKHMYATRGWLGFYSASMPALCAQVANSAGKYTAYHYVKDNTDLPYPICGLISGLGVSVFTHPIDFVRVSWQRNASVMHEMRSHGLHVLYRGYSKNIVKCAMGASTYFPIYDLLQQVGMSKMHASFSSAILSATLLQPIDFIKTMHTAGVDWRHGYCLRSYFRGYHINMARIIPHFVITVTIADYLKSTYPTPSN